MFISRLNALCKEYGISRYKLSKDTGIGDSTMYGWDKGQQPSADKLIKLAEYFEVSVDYLLGRENDIGLVEIKNEMSAEENKLLRDFRACPAAEQRVLLDYADMLYSRVEKEKKKAERF